MDYKEKYEQALEYMHTVYPTLTGAAKEDVEHHFPELKESEDESIRKHLLKHFRNKTKEEWNGMPIKNILAWLEKQGSDSIDDSKILQRFAFYTYEDEPNILYLANVFVNEDYRNKGIGSKIIKITDTVASSMGCDSIRLQCTKGSDAERLYKNNGYNELMEKDQRIWLEKQCEKNLRNEIQN